jgi:hypothetical protein
MSSSRFARNSKFRHSQFPKRTTSDIIANHKVWTSIIAIRTPAFQNPLLVDTFENQLPGLTSTLNLVVCPYTFCLFQGNQGTQEIKLSVAVTVNDVVPLRAIVRLKVKLHELGAVPVNTPSTQADTQPPVQVV